MDSWNLSIPMHFDSNITRRCWGWKYTIVGVEKYQQDKDVEKEHVSKVLETLQLPQNSDQQTVETFSHVHPASIKDMLTVSIVPPYLPPYHVCHWAESIHWILTPMNACVCFCLHQTLRHCNKTALYLRSEQELSTKSLVQLTAEHTLGKPAGHWANR